MAAKQMKFQEAMKRLDEIVALLNNNELEQLMEGNQDDGE